MVTSMTNPSSTAPRRVTREVSYASRNGYAMAAIGLALIAFGVVMLSRRAAPAVLGIAALLHLFGAANFVEQIRQMGLQLARQSLQDLVYPRGKQIPDLCSQSERG